MDWIGKLAKLDRRYIFLLVAVAVIIPQLKPFEQPMKTTQPVEAIFHHIESLPDGARVFIANDYSPSSEAELYPMTLALMRHCFERNLRVLSSTFDAAGRGILDRTFGKMEEEYDITHGIDYANFGFRVGYQLVVMQAGSDFASAFPKAKTLRTEEMPITKDIKKLADIDYFFDITSTSSLDLVWIAYGVEWFGITLGGACTAVSATQLYPYLDTGQINGLIGGLKGAAEYEILVNNKYSKIENPKRKPDKDKKGKSFLGHGMGGMGSQSIVHVLIVILVVVNNVVFLLMKRKA